MNPIITAGSSSIGRRARLSLPTVKWQGSSEESMAAAAAATVDLSEEKQEKSKVARHIDPISKRTITVDESFRRMEYVPSNLQEMVGTDPEQKNWKGVIIAVIIIITILAMIIVAIILVTPPVQKTDFGPEIKFSHVFDPNTHLRPKSINLKWLNSNTAYATFSQDEGLVKKYYKGNDTEQLISSQVLDSKDGTDLSISPSGKYALITSQYRKERRHGSSAIYHVFDLEMKDMKRVDVELSTPSPLQLATWFPQNDMLVMVHVNDVYYMDAKKLMEDGSTTPIRVSTNGKEGEMYNGIPDPLYEDEIYKAGSAVWPSPDGKYIAYGQFNDSEVERYPYFKYATDDNPIPQVSYFPYPMAGKTNPTVSMMVFNTETKTTNKWETSSFAQQGSTEGYLGEVTWFPDSTRFLMMRMNRAQDEVVTWICTASGSSCNPIYEDKRSEMGMRVSFTTPPSIIPVTNGYHIYQLLPSKSRGSQFYRHLSRLVLNSEGAASKVVRNEELLPLTPGSWDDEKIVTHGDRWMYFLSTGPDVAERHLYRLRVDITEMSDPECVSCDINGCAYVDATFSPDMEYYLLSCLGPHAPSYTLKKTEDDSYSKTLEDNRILMEELEGMSIPSKHYLEVSLDDKHTAHVEVLLPNVVDLDLIYTFPMVLFLYSEPEERAVTQEFSLGYREHLSSSTHYIVVRADMRGSAGRGSDLVKAILGQIGMAESRDLNIIGRALISLKNLKVNKDFTAIVGEGYGGYLALHTLATQESVWKCAAASQSMTDPKYYYSAFGERYLGLDVSTWPKETNIPTIAGQFQHSVLLQIFSQNDERVPYINQRSLLKALGAAGVDSKSQVYPEGGNPLSSGPTAEHYYQTLSNFLAECFTGNITHAPLVTDWNAVPPPPPPPKEDP